MSRPGLVRVKPLSELKPQVQSGNKRTVSTQTKTFDAIERLEKEFEKTSKELGISDEIKARVMGASIEFQQQFYYRWARGSFLKVIQLEELLFQSFGEEQNLGELLTNPVIDTAKAESTYNGEGREAREHAVSAAQQISVPEVRWNLWNEGDTDAAPRELA